MIMNLTLRYFWHINQQFAVCSGLPYNEFSDYNYASSVSDQENTCECGMQKLIEPGDSVMPGKGFDIAYDNYTTAWCNLNTNFKGSPVTFKKECVSYTFRYLHLEYT